MLKTGPLYCEAQVTLNAYIKNIMETGELVASPGILVGPLYHVASLVNSVFSINEQMIPAKSYLGSQWASP